MISNIIIYTSTHYEVYTYLVLFLPHHLEATTTEIKKREKTLFFDLQTYVAIFNVLFTIISMHTRRYSCYFNTNSPRDEQMQEWKLDT